MIRHAVLFSTVLLLTTTQAFSWGRVFNKNEAIPEGAEPNPQGTPSNPTQAPTALREQSDVEQPLPENLPEKTFHAARAETNTPERTPPRISDDASLRQESPPREIREIRETRETRETRDARDAQDTRDTREAREAVTVPTRHTPDNGELDALRKEVSELRQPIGPPDRVEVVGVPREHEHRIADGLADAIAGLMRVYNALSHDKGGVTEGSMRGSTNGTAVVDGEVRTSVGRGRGWAGVVVLAGVAVVVLLVGLGVSYNRDRECAVYPPRGPAFV